MTLDNIKEEILKANNILILTHESPDGDAIGSSLGMMHALKSLNKNVEVVMKELPKTYAYLPGSDEIKLEPAIKINDLVIVLDCPDKNRTNKEYWNYIEDAKVRISIDHHSKNSMFADYNFVNPASPACCQILVNVFEYFGIEITKDIATCLLTGIITDTGGFRHSGITEETFEFAAEALSMGINVSKIYRQALMVVTKPRFELQKIAMERMEFLADGKISFTYITESDMKKVGMEPGDHEGIVEMGRNIEGVEVSIFLYEKEDGYKASLRSNDYVNVADVCLIFGGGGHIKAAGCTIKLPLEEAKEKIIAETIKQLK